MPKSAAPTFVHAEAYLILDLRIVIFEARSIGSSQWMMNQETIESAWDENQIPLSESVKIP